MRILASCGSNKADWKFPPLDLMGIGGLLRKNGIGDFKILDALNLDLTHRQTKEYIRQEEPELVVFTFTVFTAKNDMRVAALSKEISPDIKTLAVNIAAESYPGNVLEDFPDVDFLAYHDPELPALDLINAGYNPEKVKGIYYKKNGEVIKNPENILENLDDIGIMAHDKIPLRIYKSPYQRRKPMSATSFSRGCINQCAHCIGSRYLNPLRLRSHENIIEEMHFLEALGVKEIRLFDGELTCNIDWAEGLFDKWLSEKIDITFSCNVRADGARASLLEKMKKAGCHLISIGFDSTSQEILDNMNKNETAEQIMDAIKLIKKMGFRLSTFTTFGHKGETKDTMLDTIKMIKKVNPDLASFSLAVPVIGTPFYDYLKENGFLNETAPLEAYDPNLPPVYSYPDFPSDHMYKIAMDAYRSFYLRPRYIAKRLFRTYHLWDDLKGMLYFMGRYVFEPISRKKIKEPGNESASSPKSA